MDVRWKMRAPVTATYNPSTMMRKAAIALVLTWLASVAAKSQPPTARIQLFLLERPIGVERATTVSNAEGRTLTSEIELVDRGTRLQLAASLSVSPDGSARHFKASGRSYRFVNVDAEVTVTGTTARLMTMGTTSDVTVPTAWFPARTWAPVAARALLIDYWEQHKRPTNMRLLPGDADWRIVITFRGDEEVQVGGRVVQLRRYSVDGVVWGRETIWIDNQGAFAALVSRVHILPLEAIREDLASALPALQASSVRDRMTDLAAFANTTRPIASGTYALSGARIITGADEPPIADGVVLVRDGRIAAVGPRVSVNGSVKVPRGVRVIDVAGATIIPGLMDMHAHASQIEWAPAYLAAGVTTIHDMGGEERYLTAFRDEIASGRGLGPRVELAGLVDGPGDGGFGTIIASTPTEGRAIVDHYHAAGFHQIKLYSLVQPVVVTAITARAHELKMTVTGHVPTALGLENAVMAGMDQIAHMSVRGQPGTPDTDRILKLLAERKTVGDPTQAWGELLGRPRDTRVEDIEPGIAQAPYPLAENYRSVLNTARATSATGAPAVSVAPQGPSMIKVMYDMGIPIVAGTDGALPGYSLIREIELYVAAGLTPLQAIQSATSVSARALGLDADVGTITMGKRADLVVLNANPLVNISALRRTRYVVTNGRMYEPAPLWRLAGFR